MIGANGCMYDWEDETPFFIRPRPHPCLACLARPPYPLFVILIAHLVLVALLITLVFLVPLGSPGAHPRPISALLWAYLNLDASADAFPK